MAVILILPFGPYWAHIYGDLHLLPTFILAQSQCKNANKKEGWCLILLSAMKTSMWRTVQDPLLLSRGPMQRWLEREMPLVKAGPTDNNPRQAGEGARSTCRSLETKHFQSIN